METWEAVTRSAQKPPNTFPTRKTHRSTARNASIFSTQKVLRLGVQQASLESELSNLGSTLPEYYKNGDICTAQDAESDIPSLFETLGWLDVALLCFGAWPDWVAELALSLLELLQLGLVIADAVRFTGAIN